MDPVVGMAGADAVFHRLLLLLHQHEEEEEAFHREDGSQASDHRTGEVV